MPVDFVGRRGALFWLALKTGFWTVLTLGFYRFWMKTRMRRYYWSAIRPGGHPMEYVGDPYEKLLGFFIAVVILTFYIGIVNLLLMFVSFSVFNGNYAGYLASFAGVIPLWFYATWRARRYVLGRTRWRGVRFALEPRAWAYTGRALLHWGITIITLGLLWPRMTFYLEKFRTDHTLFGDARFEQGGRWTMLYRAARPMGVVLGLMLLWGAWVTWLDPVFPSDWELPKGTGDTEAFAKVLRATEAPERLWALPVFLLLILYAAVHYVFRARQIMADHKRLGAVALRSALRPARIFWICSFGFTLAYVVLIVGLIGVFGLLMGVLGFEQFFAVFGDGNATPPPQWIAVPLLVMLYFTVFLMWSVFINIFVTFPKMRHMASTLTLLHADGLRHVSQRHRDEFAEAEGFAEALDLGAAI